jgi:hypothetical protein
LVEVAGGEFEHFGYRLQVPMGVRRVHVPEVGRESRQLAADVRVGVVPVDQGADRERVPVMRNSA